MINLVISFLLLLSPEINNHTAFEGSIKLIHESYYETSYYTYFVKDNNIRIDKFDCDHFLIQSLLINIKDEQIYILSPSEKLYTQLVLSKSENTNNENFTILQTENSRTVNGFKCYQWRVKNIEKNTEVAYWVIQNNFYFFEDLVKLLNRTDKTYDFFEKIPETQGFFPMMCVERTLLRREKLRISVVDINPQKIDKSKFNIPSDFEIVKL